VVTARELPALTSLSGPVFSPDGTRIAYAAYTTDENLRSSLFVSPAAGGTPTRLVPGTSPAWSPDGVSLAFLWRKPDGSIAPATLRLGSNQPPFEIPGVACDNQPEWSPSGEWIACGTQDETVLVSPDAKARRTLSHQGASVLAWSRDSRTIFGLRYSPQREARGATLMAWDVRTGMVRTVAEYQPEQLSPFSFSIPGLHLSLSPDDTSLAIGTANIRQDLWMLEGFPK
jgi:Tol biopolymer transport system component